MGETGTKMSIIAGIITLVSTFLLTWYSFGSWYANGIGGAVNLIDMVTQTSLYGVILGIPAWAVYLVLILVVLTIISGVLQLAGASSKAAAIIGSVMPIFIGIILLLESFGIYLGISFITGFPSLFETNTVVVAGILPFSYSIPVIDTSIGLLLLLVGGFLGLISGFMER